MSKWVKDRVNERTSWDGATLIGFGVVVVFLVLLLSCVHTQL